MAPYRRVKALVQLDYLFNVFSMSASDSLAQLQKVELRQDGGLAGIQEPLPLLMGKIQRRFVEISKIKS